MRSAQTGAIAKSARRTAEGNLMASRVIKYYLESCLNLAKVVENEGLIIQAKPIGGAFHLIMCCVKLPYRERAYVRKYHSSRIFKLTPWFTIGLITNDHF